MPHPGLSILNACSKVRLQTCCRHAPELLSSLIIFVSYSKKVTSEILIRIEYFILLFCTPPFPPLNQKEFLPSPLSFPFSLYAKLKMAILYYSHNDIVFELAVCYLFFFFFKL